MVDRAKQFLPFDALTGLKEALREKELQHEEKIELSDEQLEEISDMIHRLDYGVEIKVKYYNYRRYEEISGRIQKIDRINKQILINNVKINFIDIVNINII